MLKRKASRELQLPLEFLERVARSANHLYKTYQIPKRTGGTRTIHHPAKKLKAIQGWLLRHVMDDWPVHDVAHAYREGRNVRTNAEPHTGCNYLLRMDFEGFFPSITDGDIRTYLAENDRVANEWDEDDVDFFVALVTRHGALTIGAPSSPHLSNVLCYHLDGQLAEHCASREVTYTRYADDMYFSTVRRGILPDVEAEVVDIVTAIACPADLAINHEKTHHASKAGRMEVTGLVLTQEGEISVGRDTKRSLRSLVYKYQSLSDAKKHELAGYLSYVQSVEPDFINRLVVKYGADRVNDAMDMSKVDES